MSFFIRKSGGRGEKAIGVSGSGPEGKPLPSASKSPRVAQRSGRSRGGGRGGLKRRPNKGAQYEAATKNNKSIDREEISSDSEEWGDDNENDTIPSPVGSDADETPHEKRLRLAKKYLDELRAEADDGVDGHDFVTSKLEEDVLEKRGKLQRTICESFEPSQIEIVRSMRGHRLSPTCCRLSADGRHAYSASKDSSIVKWDVQTGKRLRTIPGLNAQTAQIAKGHRKPVYSLALSTDGRYLVSGGPDSGINVWSGDGLQHVRSLGGKQAQGAMGLAFRRDTLQLFCALANKSVQHFNLAEMGFVETLYGHEDEILAVDSLHQDRCLTAGGKDGTLRLWKIPEESCLVFNGPKALGSIESCSLINEQHFASGFEHGALALWSRMKKRPSCIVQQAHGFAEQGGGASLDNWVTSVRTCPNTDLVVSGSRDGFVKFWRCSQDYRELDKIAEYRMPGFINDIQITDNGQLVCCAVGQEHRLGRWWTLKEAKNAIVLFKLPVS